MLYSTGTDLGSCGRLLQIMSNEVIYMYIQGIYIDGGTLHVYKRKLLYMYIQDRFSTFIYKGGDRHVYTEKLSTCIYKGGNVYTGEIIYMYIQGGNLHIYTRAVKKKHTTSIVRTRSQILNKLYRFVSLI